MTKYIWITVGVIALVLILAWKQAPKEPAFAPQGGATADEATALQDSKPIASQSGNMKVTQPQPDSLVSSPLLVKGEARVFENTFQMILKDSTGKEIAKKTVQAKAPDVGQFGDYGELLLFDPPKTDRGTLEVFTYSAKDGAVQDLVKISVRFK